MHGRTAVLTLTLLAGSTFPAAASSIVDSLVTWRAEGRPDLVVERAGPAISAARVTGDSTSLMNLLLIRGATLAGTGRAREAEPDLRESGSLAAALGDTLRQLQTTRWLGVSVGLQGRYQEAARLYAELEVRARAAADSVHLGWAWVGLAYDHYLSGRPGPAAEHYARAGALLARHGEGPGAMWAWNGRGMVLRQAGRYAEARDAFDHVLAIATERGDAVNAATALDNLGRLDLQLGDPGLAEERFARSATIHRTNQYHREGLVPCIDLAQAREMQGRFAEAEALLDSVLVVSRDLGVRDLEVLASGRLADLHMARGRPGAAVELMREVLASGDAPSVLADTESRLRLARALAARDSVGSAIAVVEDIEQPGSVLLQLRVAATLGTLLIEADRPAEASTMLASAVGIARESGEEVQRIILLTALGRARARLGDRDAALTAYFEASDLWEEVRARPADPAWRELRGVVAGSLFAEATALLVEEPDRVGEAWSLVMRYRARTLQERIHGPATQTPVRAAPTVALDEFRTRVLRSDEAWVEIVEGSSVGILFCVTRDRFDVARIAGRDELWPASRRLREVVESPDIESAAPAGSLARSLLAQWPESVLEILDGVDHVIFCPDGTWHDFAPALAEPAWSISRAPAASVLADLRGRRPPAAGRATVLAFAGQTPQGSGPLPGAMAEVRWLEGYLAAVTQPASPADPHTWKDPAVLHFAAHTELDPWQPWNTQICVGEGEEDWIAASTIADLDLQANLVVLTGCSTAGSKVLGGEGLTGLAGAFLAAGVPTVIATLWPVDDAAAMRVTENLYDGLARGLTVDAALERARNLCRATPELAAARHWAGFVLVGEGNTEVPVRRRTGRWALAAISGALACLIYLYYRRG